MRSLTTSPSGKVPTLWLGDGIEQLVNHAPSARAVTDWSTHSVSAVPVAVENRGQRAAPRSGRRAPRTRVDLASDAPVQVLAQVVWEDGSRSPWALRAGNLTYIADNPFDYAGAGDRYLAVSWHNRTCPTAVAPWSALRTSAPRRTRTSYGPSQTSCTPRECHSPWRSLVDGGTLMGNVQILARSATHNHSRHPAGPHPIPAPLRERRRRPVGT